MLGNIVDRQTFVISVNFAALWINPATRLGNPSQVSLPMNLRFAADELILKTISYSNGSGVPDTANFAQIWCNVTNDNLIGAFPNNELVSTYFFLDQHCSISNAFQTGNLVFQFQNTSLGAPAS